MNVNDIYGTLYSPADGTIDPAGYCTALVRAATRLGAKVTSSFVLAARMNVVYREAQMGLLLSVYE